MLQKSHAGSNGVKIKTVEGFVYVLCVHACVCKYFWKFQEKVCFLADLGWWQNSGLVVLEPSTSLQLLTLQSQQLGFFLSLLLSLSPQVAVKFSTFRNLYYNWAYQIILDILYTAKPTSFSPPATCQVKQTLQMFLWW